MVLPGMAFSPRRSGRAALVLVASAFVSGAPLAAQTHRNVSPTPEGGIDKGCHTDGYWRSLAAEQLAFLGSKLT